MAYRMKEVTKDRNGMWLSCDGNRRLINAAKKAGLTTFTPLGEWNGYGYTRLSTAVKIETVSELKKFTTWNNGGSWKKASQKNWQVDF